MHYCPSCGHPLAPSSGGPVQCSACKRVHYRNPINVGVAIVPVHDENGECIGILGVRRGNPNDPGIGKLALPGGFQEWGEDILLTARRETLEETGLDLPGAGQIVHTQIVADGGQQLVFVKMPPIDMAMFSRAKVMEGEVLEIALLIPGVEMAFPAHQAQVDAAMIQIPAKTRARPSP